MPAENGSTRSEREHAALLAAMLTVRLQDQARAAVPSPQPAPSPRRAPMVEATREGMELLSAWGAMPECERVGFLRLIVSAGERWQRPAIDGEVDRQLPRTVFARLQREITRSYVRGAR